MVIKSWSETKNKKALSTVVATVLMILLVMVAASIVWAFVNNIVKSKTEGVQSCFDATSSGKVTLEDSYTCYQPINNKTPNEVQFSINIGDVSIDSLVVSILVGGNSKSFTLTNNATAIPYLRPYTGSYGDNVTLPGKNEGKTYVADFSAEFGQGAVKVDSIRIAPVVEGKQCDESDETNQIDFCSLYAS